MRIVLILLMVIAEVSCSSQTKVNDSTFSKMFWLASGKITRNDTTFQTLATSPFYVVITVTDLKINYTKEICVEYPYIEGAIEKDSGNTFIDIKNRIFKFKSDEALNNVGFWQYDTVKYKSCIAGITKEQLQREWNEDLFEFRDKYSGECQIYYAYFLFKNGVLSTRGSLAGGFSIVDDKELMKIEKRILRQ